VYRSGAFSTGVGAIIPITGPFTLDIEAAYKKMPARDGSPNAQLELLPISFLGEWIPDGPGGSYDLFVGMGPSFTVFTEQHPDNVDLGVIRGTRIAIETRFGGRVDTGLVRPPMAPAPQGLHALELEVYGARRFQRPGLTGFQLGAWRAGLGLVFRL
jgi:hypothetical protein